MRRIVTGVHIVFPRLPDHERGHSVVTRDDGVVYHLNGGPVTAALPHDLVHLVAEESLRIPDGIWGAIAGGVVFKSMTHVSGRRAPHEAERSAALLRRYRGSIGRAELLGGVVERLAAARVRDVQLVRRMAAGWLSTQPTIDFDADRLLAAAYRLREAGARWAALPVGTEYACEWPAHRRLRPEITRSRRSRPVRRMAGA